MREPIDLRDVIGPIHERIEGVGWALVHVGGGLQAGAWTYSIGLTASFGHPELIVMGLRADHGDYAVNWLARHVSTGVALETGETLDVDGVPILIGPVHDDHWRSELFGLWHQYHLARVTRNVRAKGALQVLWPDNEGCFPGDPCFEPRLAHLQPILAVGGKAMV